MINILILLGFVCIITYGIIAIRLLQKRIDRPIPQQNLTIDITALQRTIDNIPVKVLQTINGSINSAKGPLGELVGYLQIRASYDRIIPLGDITDFIAIKLPSIDQEGKEIEGHVDFIDVKTGDKSRLSKDQRALQKLIQEKKINFIKLRIDDISSEDISKQS